MNARLALLPAVASAVALFAAIACGGESTPDTQPPASAQSGFGGVVVTPPYPKPDVVLTDTSGQPFDFLAQTEGFVTLLYLGYTHCPDVCPTHMADISATLKRLPPEVAGQIKVVFLTVDPERDTPERLRQWLDLFGSEFIGLRASPEELGLVLRSLAMPPIRTTDLGGGQYAVSHAAYVLAYSTDNVAHLIYPLGTSREVWEHDLLLLVREGYDQ
jgi:protein SCO1/2